MLFQQSTFTSILLALGYAANTTSASSHILPRSDEDSELTSRYAPVRTTCRSKEPYVRDADSLNPLEARFVEIRKKKASTALKKWLTDVDDSFWLSKTPTLALASSGGGYRAMLTGAGVVQAMDARDSDEPTNGLYQSLVYHSGLSGGSWLLGSLAANRWDTVSATSDEFWTKALINNTLYPGRTEAVPEKGAIIADLEAKAGAGFQPTTTDVWGRFLSYQLLPGEDGGVDNTWSGVRKHHAFKDHDAPFPIITALGVENIGGSICDPADNGTQYEFTPYEFGSWDPGVLAFTPTELLGSTFDNGDPNEDGVCYKNYDNLGYIMGTSSSKFQESCGDSLVQVVRGGLDPFLKSTNTSATSASVRRSLYAPYPNPFKNYDTSTKIRTADELYLLDGGQANQNNPIWPFIQPQRRVDVLIVNDNSADTDDNWPNGTEILHTYDMAKAAGLTRMPDIPPVDQFVARNLTYKAAFFGCNQREKLTIVWLPNAKYTFDSNVGTSQFDYTANETLAMIENGNKIATQGGDKEWPLCLACGIAHKTVRRMPGQCKACLERYCYKP